MEDSSLLVPEVLVPRLGDSLIQKGLITQSDLIRALDIQREMQSAGTPPLLLGKILINLGVIDQTELDKAVTEQILKLKYSLLESNHHLEREVFERTKELELALEKLSELNILKSNFVSMVSHELRTPLTHIKGYLEILFTKKAGPLLPDQVIIINTIKNSADRLEKLIDELLQFSNGDPKKEALNPIIIDFRLLCISVSNKFNGLAENNGVLFFTNFSDDDIFIRGDERQLVLLINQLLDNALKFTPKGGKIHFSALPEGNYLKVSVRDSGIGIPEDKIHEVFDPFYQIDGSLKRRFGGIGLGLALAKNIAQAHGIRLNVHSEEGNGSEFFFFIPILDQGR